MEANVKPPKPPKLGPHEYGNVPNFKNLEKFVRDSRISNELPIMEELIQAQKSVQSRRVAFFIRLASPVLLAVALILGFYTFYTAMTSSNGYGQNYNLAETTFSPTKPVVQETDPAKYVFKINTGVTYQVLALRGGQGGQFLNMTVLVPPASDMISGSIVVARNASIYIHINETNDGGPPKNMLVIFQDGLPTIELSVRQSVSIMAIGDKWYKGLFLKGLDQ